MRDDVVEDTQVEDTQVEDTSDELILDLDSTIENRRISVKEPKRFFFFDLN